MGVLFEHPEWAMSVAIVFAILSVATIAAQELGRRRIQTLLGRGSRLRRGVRRSDFLLLGALLFTAAALLGPRIGERSVLVSTRGADVVFLFDVSKSMDAQDVPPSRMQRARSAVDHLLQRLEPEDRAALAVFAGRGVLLTPLTPDAAALREMLEAIDTSLIRPSASDLDMGVNAALAAFEEASDRPRVLVVLSDGEVVQRDTGKAANAALRQNVRVLALPFGTETGATIPHEGGELRDGTGHVVVSRRRTEPLAALAEASEGRLFRTNEWGEFDVVGAAKEIGREARGKAGELVERRVKAPMVLPFAAIAFLLLCAEWFPRDRFETLVRVLRRAGGDRPRPTLQPIAATLWLLLFMIVARPGPAEPEMEAAVTPPSESEQVVAELEARARKKTLNARELLALGIARARSDRWEEAEHSLLAAALAARDPHVAAIAYHDLGVTALRNEELERARDFFFDSLALRPGHVETRFNLEWTIAAMQVEPPAPEQPPMEPMGANSSESDSEENEAEPDEPQEALPAARPPAQKPAEENARTESKAEAPELTDSQRERWLERIEDDPARALASATRPPKDSPQPKRRRDAPTW